MKSYNKKLSLFGFVIALFIVIPASVFVYAQSTATSCYTTKIGTANGNPIMPAGCDNNGTLPGTDRTTLLAQIKTLVSTGKLSFAQPNDKAGMTNGTGQVKRDDGTMITIDTQILRFYVYMTGQGYTMQISSMVGTHPKLSSSGNVSRHWDGHAADVSIINGKVVNQTSAKDEVMKFMKTLNALIGKDLSPDQLLCAGAGVVDPTVDALSMNNHKMAPGFTGLYVGDHTDHVHVGY